MMSETCLKQTCCTTFSADTTAFCRVQGLPVAVASISITSPRCLLCITWQRKTQQEPKHETDSAPISVLWLQNACTVFHQHITLAATMLFCEQLPDSACSALKLMPQTSALVQLINAFCCSRASSPQSAVDACQYGYTLPDSLQAACAHSVLCENFQVLMQLLSQPLRHCHDVTAVIAKATTNAWQGSSTI